MAYPGEKKRLKKMDEILDEQDMRPVLSDASTVRGMDRGKYHEVEAPEGEIKKDKKGRPIGPYKYDD